MNMGDIVISMGEINTQLPNDNSVFESTMGRQGIGLMSKWGIILEFLSELRLEAISSLTNEFIRRIVNSSK